MTRNVRASTGDKILQELYDISRRYINSADMRSLPDEGTESYGNSQLWQLFEMAATRVDAVTSTPDAPPALVRDAVLDLATCAVAIAREIREQ